MTFILRIALRPLIAVAAAMLLYVAMSPPAAQAAQSPGTPFGAVDKVVVIVMDRVTLLDLENSRSFKRLLDKGTSGVISSPVEGQQRPPKYYLSLGAGDIAGGNWRRENAYRADEPYGEVTGGELYEARSGVRPPRTALLETDIFAIRRASENQPRKPRPGALGDALSAAGKRIALIGDADIIDPSLRSPLPLPHRETALIFMDGDGVVADAVVGDALNHRDGRYLPGLRTDAGKLKSHTLRALERADVVALTLGDTYRVSAYAGAVSTERLDALKARSIESYGSWLAHLMREVEAAEVGRVRYLLVSPTPPRRAGRYAGMPPMVVLGDGAGKGMLVSPTTRRTGIVGNVDLAPTVLSWLGVERPWFMPGRAVMSSTVPGGQERVIRDEERSAQMFFARPAAVSAVFILFLGFFVAVAVSAFTAQGLAAHKRSLGAVSLLVLSLPLGYLLASGVVWPQPAWLFVIALLAASAVLALLASALRSFVHPVVSVGLLTVLIVLADAIGGPNLLFDTVLGYSPLYGARYYGLGNEMMAITVAAIIIAAAVVGKPGRVSLASISAAFLSYLVFIGHPSFGANVGGTVTACAGFGFALLMWVRGRISVPGVVSVAFITILVLAAFTAIDLSRVDAGSSHLGMTGDNVEATGLSALLPVVARKLTAGLRISTEWAVPFGLLIAAAVIAWRLQPPAEAGRALARYPMFRGAAVALTAAAVAGALSNDSGLVIPMLITVYLGTAAIVLVLDEVGPVPKEDEARKQDAEAPA